LTRRAALVVVLAIAGFAFYLWPALRAPVVLWSDSELDLRWAAQQPMPAGAVPGQMHPAKPAYLSFLRAAMRIGPRGAPTRSIVVLQSLLVWVAFAATSLHVGRRRGYMAGVLLYCALLSFVRFRDATSSIFSEPLAIAIVLPLTALLLERRADAPIRCLALGLAVGLLFLVRPNVGLPIGVAAVLLRGRRRDARNALRIVAGAFCIVGPILLFLRPAGPRDALGGIGAPVLLGSATYYSASSLGPSVPEDSPQQLREASRRWGRFLGQRGPDARRELAWRAFHGIVGTELYDARWSATYQAIDTAGRVAGPFLTILAICALLAGRSPEPDGLQSAVSLLFVPMLVGHDLVFGSHPRYLLPFLPVLFLLAVERLSAMRLKEWKRWSVALVLAAGMVAGVRASRGIVDWEAGIIESAGVEIVQRIPARSLPPRSPARLHIRIAPSMLPSGAQLIVSEPGVGLLYDGQGEPDRSGPVISMDVPQMVLTRNREADVELHLRATGVYDAFHFLLFPVIPPPWADRARRVGSEELSPRTGIASGGLDWWAHSGKD
jgi:hypothetical protein